MNIRKQLNKNATSGFLLMSLFSFLMAGSLFAQNQVIVRLKVPPPNKMNIKEMWRMNLKNTTGKEMKIYLEGNASEEKDGLLAEGKTKPFILPPGERSYGYDDFKNGTATWKNKKKYEEAFMRTGNIPSGNYTYCVTAFAMNGDVVGQENCVDHKIEIATDQEITLMQPDEGEKINSKSGITFAWAPLTPAPADGYKIKIVEIRGEQSAEAAMKENTSVFQQDKIRTSTFQYPMAAPKLTPGKKYAWNMSAMMDGSTPVSSNASTFIIQGCDVALEIKLDSVKCLPGADGINNYKIYTSSTYTSSTYNLTYANTGSGFQSYHPSFSPSYPITNLNPALSTQLSGPSSIRNYSFDVAVPSSQTSIVIALQGDDKDPGPIVCQPGASITINLPSCYCNPCKDSKVKPENEVITSTNNASNEILLSGIFSGLDPNLIQKISFELIYFDIIQTGDSNCASCSENINWGNFIPPANSTFTGFNTPALNAAGFGRMWTWTNSTNHLCANTSQASAQSVASQGGCASCPKGNDFAPAKKSMIVPLETNNAFSLPIAVPAGNSLSCCSSKIKICIRYSWTDFCCHSCSLVKCYEIERKPEGAATKGKKPVKKSR